MPRVRVSRGDYYRQWSRTHKRKHRPIESTILGLDGEGLTREGVHSYNYFAVCDNGNPVAAAETLDGTLSTRECFDTLLSLRDRYAKLTIVGFSLGYDYTHILRDLPNDKLYLLYRPEFRRNESGHLLPVIWRGYVLNYMRGRFTIARRIEGKHRDSCDSKECRGCTKGPSVTVWDIFGFFQASFVKSCLDWKVINKDEHDYLLKMKDARPTFSIEQWQEIKTYCHLECKRLAELFSRLIEAHRNVDLKLSSFFGAGSTASVLLRKLQIKQNMPIERDLPPEVLKAAQFAFFGGRFEVSRVGPYTGKVYSYDIASAYPYQIVQLPCLACGRWRHVKGARLRDNIKDSRFALVRYSVHGARTTNSTSDMAWGPLPFRCADVSGVGPLDSILDDGSIVYPASSGGGWTYRDEYLVAAEHWPVKAHEAWIYETSCDHRPFESLAQLYVERCRIGKEGPGIVLKLALNSCYGKLAQSIGQAQYRCSLWAGAITSGCRAQLLQLIAQKPLSILSVATDGIVSIEPLDLPEPVDTGTVEGARQYGKPGLGAWEAKEIDGGIMLIRPGIVFSLAGVLEQTRARGVGKSTLERHKEAVMKSWRENGPKDVIFNHTIFRGAKSCIHPNRGGFSRSPEYGQWTNRQTIITYNPEPKRPYDTQSDGRLSTWAFSKSKTSAAYDREIIPADIAALIANREVNLEQPDIEELDNEF